MSYTPEQLGARMERQNGQALVSTEGLIPGRVKPDNRGKVRESYDLGENLMVVATDRISVFDVVLPTSIPGKGMALTQMTLFWPRILKDIVPIHTHTDNPVDFPEPFNRVPELEGRTMMVEKLNMILVECIVRGYITGSAWSEYRKHGTVQGQSMRPGMVESARFDHPLFTPTNKAPQGEHDTNISFERMVEIVDQNEVAHKIGARAVAERMRDVSLAAYVRAADHAWARGVIIADTKMEFGMREDGSGLLVLTDEILTPDSSRFWPREKYIAGGPQPSLDKQYVRDYAEGLGWKDHTPPGPELPLEVVAQTQAKYLEAYRRLFSIGKHGTGRKRRSVSI